MEKHEVYKGKLGFEGSAKDALSHAASVVIETFEEHGHEVFSFGARSTGGVSLDLDHFSIEVRLRPQMKRGWKAPQSQGDTLEVRITALYPEVFDRHLCEMLLAAVLHNLVTDLGAVSIQWLQSPHVLTREQFLSVFEPLEFGAFDTAPEAEVPALPIAMARSETSQEDVDLPEVEILHAEEVELPQTMRAAAHDRLVGRSAGTRPRGRDVFAPVDATIEMLEHHCDEILMADHTDTGRNAARWSPAEQKETNPSKGVAALTSLPRSFAAGAMRFFRANDLRYGLHVLMLMATVLYLDSASMVRAAISLLDLSH